MSPALLAVASGAGLACPAHMWWQQRRGKRAACTPRSRGSSSVETSESLSTDAVRERQRGLAAQLRAIDAGRDEGAEVGSS